MNIALRTTHETLMRYGEILDCSEMEHDTNIITSRIIYYNNTEYLDIMCNGRVIQIIEL